MLRAGDVSFAYPTRRVHGPGTTPALAGVTIEIARGTVVGLLGPNGSGKSTLVRVLAGLLRPISGSVTLDGLDLARVPRRLLARRIAVVPQETRLAFEYSVLEIALMGRYPHLGPFELEGPRDLKVARDALAATGTADLAARPFDTLSGGEKQRVIIASALAQAADIMLLDEPTASLDLAYQLELAALIARLNRDRGVTLVIATHDLNLASALCRELVLLKRGRVLASGETGDVLRPDAIAALYGVEVEVQRHARAGHAVVVPIRRLRD